MLSGRAVLSVESSAWTPQYRPLRLDCSLWTPQCGIRNVQCRLPRTDSLEWAPRTRANSSKQSLFVMYKQKSTTARIKQNKIRSNRLDAVRAHTGELCRLH